MQGTFDANAFQPQYAIGNIHPPGLFEARIANTECVPVKDKPNSGMFVITYETPAGQIKDRFNLWNESQKAVEIASKQLSAVCHATGVFKINWSTQGAELRGAMLKIEVALQDATKPDGYTEVKKIFDRNGNEPGKAPSPAPQPQQGQQGGAPMTQQPGGGWGQAPTQNNAPPANSGGWGGGQAQPQPQSNSTGKPPWAS